MEGERDTLRLPAGVVGFGTRHRRDHAKSGDESSTLARSQDERGFDAVHCGSQVGTNGSRRWCR